MGLEVTKMNENYFVRRERCPACMSTHSQELYSFRFTEPPIRTYLETFYTRAGGIEFDYLEGTKFVLDECIECGLVYQQLIPNEFLTKKLYEEWIDPEAVFNRRKKKRGIDYYARLSKEIEIAIKYLGVPLSELRLFDFGMGWGDWCRMAIAHGCSAYGTELSQARIDYAKSLGISVIDWEEIPKYQFDLINLEQVLEHISNPLETLHYLSKSLKQGGIIKIGVPNGWDIKRRLVIMDWAAPKRSANSLNPVAPLEHINCFSQGSLVKIAQLAGLVPVQIPSQTNKIFSRATLRELKRYFYYWIRKDRYGQKVGSTKLFFRRVNE